MSDPIAEYQQWKKQGGDLRTRAKQAMEARFRELLTEAVQLAEEYRGDFGVPLALPAVVTAFKFKPGGKKAAKKSAAAGSAAAPAAVQQTVTKAAAATPKVAVDPKIAALEKQLAAARKKLEAAQAKGAATKNLEDRIYELEDDLRLATHGE
jgi:uncharacterized protein YceH (UPF0502 family)